MGILDDDWMNPQRYTIYKSEPHADGTFYVIQRKKRTPVTGNVGFIEEWDFWKEFEDKRERDEELARLRETTSWVLRGRQTTYIGGQPIARDPFEHMDY